MTWTQQFLPEVYEKEVERYGNRTITGFLRMVGAEMPMASDRVVWSEQGRLHIAYDNVSSNGPAAGAAQIISLPSPQPASKIEAPARESQYACRRATRLPGSLPQKQAQLLYPLS